MSRHTCVVGLGWGDEGKGKVVDLLAGRHDIVVRYNGGANAGHTVCIGDRTFSLHLLPAGVLRDGVAAVIGPGVVIDPLSLSREIAALENQGMEINKNLRISDRAHLVLPHHTLQDRLSEQRAGDGGKLGTTVRGIGPCYADKMRRMDAVRVCEVEDRARLRERVAEILARRFRELGSLFGEDGIPNDLNEQSAAFCNACAKLVPFICDCSEYLFGRVDAGARLLFEGANGVLLDVDHGTYPFVTSSATGSGGVANGAGVPPSWVGRVVGVTKAYSTRVGSGPFVTELEGSLADYIRTRGREFGTTTGRPRRCGWLDLVTCRYAARLSGASALAVMHLDTLAGLDEIAVCTAYETKSGRIMRPPARLDLLKSARPVLEKLPGWSEAIRDCPSLEALPAAARSFLRRIEEYVGCPVAIVSLGPKREQTLVDETALEC